MAKRYTKTQAKRALESIKGKVYQMFLAGYVSQGDFLTMTGKCDRALKRLK
jgi:hypothetical protein